MAGRTVADEGQGRMKTGPGCGSNYDAPVKGILRTPLPAWLLALGLLPGLATVGVHLALGGLGSPVQMPSLFRRAEARLRRAPVEPAPTILVLGDSGAASPEFRATVAAMAKESALLAVHAGDCTYRGTAEYVRFVAAFERLPFPLVAVPGDHDRETDPTFREWDRRLGGRDSHLDGGGVRVFLLDTSGETLAAESLAKMEAALDDPRRPPTAVVVTHCPPWQPGKRYPEGLGREHALHPPESARLLVESLAKRRVSLVACGHWHAFADMRDAGFPIVVSGGGGSDLEPGETFHYARVVLSDPVRIEKVTTAPAEGLGRGGRILDALAYRILAHGLPLSIACLVLAAALHVRRSRRPPPV
jgi:predicted phosphodiesterase